MTSHRAWILGALLVTSTVLGACGWSAHPADRCVAPKGRLNPQAQAFEDPCGVARSTVVVLRP